MDTRPAHAGANEQHAERIERIENGLYTNMPPTGEAPRAASLAERMAYHHVPGVSVAVIHDGRLAWAKGYGVTEAGTETAVTPDTIFQACSISKAVTAVALWRLAQDGMLDLDEDVNAYLTSWKIGPNGGWQPRVTPRHLLCHSAGLTYNWYRGFRRGQKLPTLLQVLRGVPPANTPEVRSVLVPGTQFRYSGSHYSVLQQMMEDLTGKPFATLMHELVFEPLGMRNSSFDQRYPDSRPDTTAVGHYIGGEPVYGKWRVLPEMAAAGLWTTPTDLALLAIEIMRTYNGHAGNVLRTPFVQPALALQPTGEWGLGFHLPGKGQAQRFEHSGGNIGYACLLDAYKEKPIGAVVMTNSDDGSTLSREIFQAIARAYDWPEYVPAHVAVPVDPHGFADYIGEYQLHRGYNLHIEQQGDQLYLHPAGQQPLPLYPTSDTDFFAQEIHAEVSFVKNAEGAVTALVLRQQEAQDTHKGEAQKVS